MTRWLQAAIRVSAHEDSLNPPKAKTPITPETHAKGDIPRKNDNPKEVLGSFGGFVGRAKLETPEPSPSRTDRPTLNADGYAKTWTGRVVSLADWRMLSDWDKHGPQGRLHCGICKQWVERGAPCGEAGCWKGGAE